MKENFGKVYTDHFKANMDEKAGHIPVFEQTKQNLLSYEDNVRIAAIRGQEKYQSDHFYVTVIMRYDKLFPNSRRLQYLDTRDCPTPDYDRNVYRCSRKDRTITYLWTIPDKETCEWYKANALHVHEDEWKLLDMVLMFYDGTLEEMAKKYNKEDKPNPIIEVTYN